MVILAVEFVDFLNKKREELAWVFIALYVCVIIYSISGYVNIYQPEGIFYQPEEIATALRNAPGNLPIYGEDEVAPLLSLMSGRQIFDNMIDTSIQHFASGAQDMNALSEKAAENGIYFVARVANYPDQNIHDTGFEEYFDKKVFDSSCKLYKAFDRSVPDDPLNQVAIYKCSAS